MSDETVIEEPTGGQERTVPYARFAEMNRRAKDAENQLKDLQDRLGAIEERDKSEVQKVTSRAEKAETRASELEQRLVRMERSSWLRDAASGAKFDDPGDAVAFAGDLADIESLEDAQRFVKDLAKRKPRLLRSEEPQVPGQQVLKDGQQVPNNANKLPGQQAGDGQNLSDQDRAFLDQIQGAQQGMSQHSTPLFP